MNKNKNPHYYDKVLYEEYSDIPEVCDRAFRNFADKRSVLAKIVDRMNYASFDRESHDFSPEDDDFLDLVLRALDLSAQTLQYTRIVNIVSVPQPWGYRASVGNCNDNRNKRAKELIQEVRDRIEAFRDAHKPETKEVKVEDTSKKAK